MRVVAYGGGINSTAMLIGMVERRMPVDLVLFADTGGEKPHTYEYIKLFSKWLIDHEMPEIITVHKGGRKETLEENCLRMKMLPSLAYGFKGCSHKYKIEPQDKYCNNHEGCRQTWDTGKKIVKFIGYDADEHHRAKIPEDKKYVYEYPLVDWDWGRDECIEAIHKAGLPIPGKSACFFCPASKPTEIKQLQEQYPNLAARALQMESNAELTSVKGLGRDWPWRDLLATNDMFGFKQHIEISCGCYDG